MLIATSLNIGVGRCSETSLMPLLAEAGFQGVDFNFCDHLDREDWTRPDAGNAWTDGMARAADEAGLKWVQAHGPMFSPEADAQTERGVMLCKTSIRLCGRLGVPWMVLHPNPTAQIHDPARPGPAIENIAAFFRKLLPDCEKANVGIAIENVSDGRAKDAPPSKPLRFGPVAQSHRFNANSVFWLGRRRGPRKRRRRSLRASNRSRYAGTGLKRPKADVLRPRRRPTSFRRF